MEGEKYNLGKAHEESTKLSKRVESPADDKQILSEKTGTTEDSNKEKINEKYSKLREFLLKNQSIYYCFGSASAEEIREKLEITDSEEGQQEVLKVIETMISQSNISAVVDFRKRLGLSRKLHIESPEAKAKVTQYFADRLQSGYDIHGVRGVLDAFEFNKDLVSQDLRNAFKVGIVNGFKKNYTIESLIAVSFKEISDICEAVGIKFDDSEKEDIAKNIILENIYNNSRVISKDDVLRITLALNVPDSVSNSPEIIGRIEDLLPEKLSQGFFMDDIRKLWELSVNHPEILNAPAVLSAAKKGLIKNLTDRVMGNGYENSLEIKRMFLANNPEILNSKEIQKAAKVMCIRNLNDAYRNIKGTDKAIQLKREFSIEVDDPEIKKQATLLFSQCCMQVKLDAAKEIVEQFLNYCREDVLNELIVQIKGKLHNKFDARGATQITIFFLNDYPDLLKSPQVLEQAELYFEDLLKKADFSEALEFNKRFLNEYPESLAKVLKRKVEMCLIDGDIEKVSAIKNSFKEYSNLDNELAISIQSSDKLIGYIKLLDNTKLQDELPLTFSKIVKTISEGLSYNQDLADYFVENLEKYYQQPWVAESVIKAIQQYSVAQKFIYAVENDQTTWKNETWVVDVFAKAKVIVEEHQKQFDQDDDGQDSYGYSHGNEGFSESDPFANHPWRFGERQIRIASAVAELMGGKTDVAGLKELGISGKEISPLLAEANEKINTAYQNFLEQIRSNTNIKEDDKQAFLNPESSTVKMTSLLDNVRAFVARYFVQSVEGDVTRLSEIGNLSSELDRVLAEGFRRYIKIHEVDVPLYDKLYEEFDNLRETGRSPLEVYLGRDGIYAYIGRHSQDVARRRKLGLEGRKKLKEMGEVVEIHPQYTVYPRYFRDNLNQETKRQFLEQEGISPDADPLFYDTGYTGTIPEQIMKVMDFSQEDIERRIRLLSAPSVHRRVKGIPENARSEIIEYIEHNAKAEETAEGLIIDEKTGKIRHVAKPTNPEEQFYFMMVKQAVARHYWLKEQLHHEPSGNVNLDSEHYTIRIRQEYAKLLPPDFMQNPKEFLTQHGEMLKGSKGEGEYPDEEVVLFKMIDGTEIVAKKIELRKAKEARKEFSILISAKKAGLPTAEPVGFLSGKEESDGSYLLMKKLEGISGRNFDKYLRDTGKFTEEKIKSILQQVAEKNKEIAELFRATLKIDKRWRIKDTIIELNEETGEVESVVPIDWERAQNFNPSTPKEIDKIV